MFRTVFIAYCHNPVRRSSVLRELPC